MQLEIIVFIKNLLSLLFFKGKQYSPLKIPNRGLLIIPESDLYRLIMRSRAKRAFEFQAWVTEEMLPTIRKTGSYSLFRNKQELPSPQQKRISRGKSWDELEFPSNMPTEIISSKDHNDFLKLPITERCTLEINNMYKILSALGVNKNSIGIALDKVSTRYVGHSLLKESKVPVRAENNDPILTPTEIGQEYGVSAKEINRLLQKKGFQYKENKYWKPTEKGDKYAVTLWVDTHDSKRTPVLQLKWKSDILEILDRYF